MTFYCIPQVKVEIEKLSKNNSYKNLKPELFYFFDEIISGKYGKANLSKEEIKNAQRAFKNHYESGDFFKIVLDHKKQDLKFESNITSSTPYKK